VTDPSSDLCAPVRLSIVVPFYNERHRLDRSLDAIAGQAGDDVEVILVDDGSTDGTAAVLSERADASPGVRAVLLPANRGKGAAVRAGIAVTHGERIMFMDADVATDLGDIPRLVAALDGAAVAIGSREAPESELRNTTRVRTTIGNVFNAAVRALTGLPFRDTQCGFKAFRGDVGRNLFARSTIDGFAFDVEVLMLARASGHDIVEVPVRWTEVPGSKVRFGLDPGRMLFDVVRVRRRQRRSV